MRNPHIIWPVVCNSKSPAWFVAEADHTVLFSWSDHATFLGLPPAPRQNTKRSSVTTIDLLPTGALVTCAATVLGLPCHSYNFPSFDDTASKYSPHVSNAHVVASE